MPRNGTGTFGVLTPIQVAALRSSSVVNADFSDMGAEITNSLPLDGQAGMSGPMLGDLGTVIAPGFAWSADLNTGFRRSAPDEMKWVSGGVDRMTMDENGKITLGNGIAVTGAVNLSAILAPQTLDAAGQPVAIFRRSENDTTEREIMTYEAGSGAGAKGSLRVVGGGANNVATTRLYVNDIKAFEWTSALFNSPTALKIGSATAISADDAKGMELTEITAPSAPSTNVARFYCRDNGGISQLFWKDADGAEHVFSSSLTRQVFTASGTWTKPTLGTVAMVEMWGGGAGGGATTSSLDYAGGGGGGAYNRRIIALASLSASVSVTIGSGGSAVSGVSVGNDGGTSTFGGYLRAYGGGAGCLGPGSGNNGGAGGGGGLTSTGTTASSSSGGSGGTPFGVLGSDVWGGGGFSTSDVNSNPFGGGGGSEAGAGGTGLNGGGAGGPAGSTDAAGDSVFGGAGGGGDGQGGVGNPGVSILGGNGGDGGGVRTGSIPGGGGAGNNTGTSGAGARGEVRVTVW